MDNKTKQAMQMALDTLIDAQQYYGSYELGKEAITALREALQEHALQTLSDIHQQIEQPQGEPVGWCVHPFDYGVGHAGIYAMTQRPEQVEAWKRKGWEVKPLYTTPPSVEAAIEATKEKAAKVCESEEFAVWETAERIAAAIRSMK
jgi:hypothetical protein